MEEPDAIEYEPQSPAVEEDFVPQTPPDSPPEEEMAQAEDLNSLEKEQQELLEICCSKIEDISVHTRTFAHKSLIVWQ